MRTKKNQKPFDMDSPVPFPDQIDNQIRELQNEQMNDSPGYKESQIAKKLMIGCIVLVVFLIGYLVYTYQEKKQNEKDMIELKIEQERIRQGLKNQKPHIKNHSVPKQEL